MPPLVDTSLNIHLQLRAVVNNHVLPLVNESLLGNVQWFRELLSKPRSAYIFAKYHYKLLIRGSVTSLKVLTEMIKHQFKNQRIY